jgi:hypothetical protein
MAPRQDLHKKKHSAPGKIYNKRQLNLIYSTRCFFKYRDAPEFCIVKSSSPPAFIILVGHAPEACSPHHEKFHKERRNVIGPKILAGLKSGFELRVHGIFNLNCRPSKNSKPHTRPSTQPPTPARPAKTEHGSPSRSLGMNRLCAWIFGSCRHLNFTSQMSSVKTAANQSTSPKRLRGRFSEGAPHLGQ